MKISKKLNFRCWKKIGHGKINIVQAIERSCNIFFANLGLFAGVNNIYNVAKELGIGEFFDINLPEYNNGIFNLIQIVSTIPVDWTKHNGVAAIRISSDDKFVYVSNRGHNSIAVFEVEEDGILKLIQTISTNGDFPRDFALDNSERFIVVAHQNSTIASLFARNATSGKLELLQTDIPVPEGVCVYFVK